MITKLSHATIYVTDQDEALRFYRDKLGFKVNTDMTMEGGFRWLTVSPPRQPELQIVLYALAPSPMMSEAVVEQLRGLVRAGALGTGVLEADDCRATYEELSAQGVEFLAPPQEQAYGIEAILKDPAGNWFSMVQRRSG